MAGTAAAPPSSTHNRVWNCGFGVEHKSKASPQGVVSYSQFVGSSTSNRGTSGDAQGLATVTGTRVIHFGGHTSLSSKIVELCDPPHSNVSYHANMISSDLKVYNVDITALRVAAKGPTVMSPTPTPTSTISPSIVPSTLIPSLARGSVPKNRFSTPQ